MEQLIISDYGTYLGKGMTQKTQLFRHFQSDPWVPPVVGYNHCPDE